MRIRYTSFDSTLGAIRLARDEVGICGLWFHGQRYEQLPLADWHFAPHDALLNNAMAQLHDYLQAARRSFSLPISISSGSTFQQTVWRALVTIEPGTTCTYSQLANVIDRPRATRACASAIGRNPISIIIPCHRVIGANGKLSGYAGGLHRKQELLNLESAANKPANKATCLAAKPTGLSRCQPSSYYA